MLRVSARTTELEILYCSDIAGSAGAIMALGRGPMNPYAPIYTHIK